MRSRHIRRATLGVLVAAIVIASATFAWAQFRNRGRFGVLGLSGALAPEELPDGDFVLCRLVYTEGIRFAQGWQTDYPLGERNLSIRFSEITRTRVSRAGDGSPNHYLVRATDDALFQCPFLMAGDPGSMGLTEPEVTRLREYLLKGGFLWVDDMWGSQQWAAFTYELAKIFPPNEYPIEDVPLTDPLFSAQFIVDEMPQIPNIMHWRSTGNTSEQGADSAIPYFRAVRDDHGRIMVAITHNTDIADAFEREGEDPQYFYQFSPKGYALGINVLLHALTH